MWASQLGLVSGEQVHRGLSGGRGRSWVAAWRPSPRERSGLAGVAGGWRT